MLCRETQFQKEREEQAEVKLTANCKIQWEVELAGGPEAQQVRNQGRATEQNGKPVVRAEESPQPPDAPRAGSQPPL